MTEDQEAAPVSGEKVDYEKYVVRKALAEYWRADEKVEIVMMGLAGRIPITMLCRLNNVTPSQYYEWREKFIAQGKGAFAHPGPIGSIGRSASKLDRKGE